MEKIVTLIPSATEIVAFLGKKNLIVGRSHECDYPKDLNKIKKLTSPKINIDVVKSPNSKSLIWPYLFIEQNYLYKAKLI